MSCDCTGAYLIGIWAGIMLSLLVWRIVWFGSRNKSEASKKDRG